MSGAMPTARNGGRDRPGMDRGKRNPSEKAAIGPRLLRAHFLFEVLSSEFEVPAWNTGRISAPGRSRSF